jgi:hypothetical protein
MGLLGVAVGSALTQSFLSEPWAKGQSGAADSSSKSLTTQAAGSLIYGKMDGSGSVPRLIPFQAYLTDNNGRPVEGQHNLTFKLYDQAESGNYLGWTETHANVPVSKGMVNVLLGRDPPQGTPFETLTFDGPRYVSVSVDGGLEMVPRQQIVPAIYAADADRSLQLAGGTSGFLANSTEITPVGAVIAWFGDPADLPGNWVLCDGRTISDEQSPLNGTVTPDLRGRFLRGEIDSTRMIRSLGPNNGGKDADGWSVGTHNHAVTVTSVGNHVHSTADTGSHKHRWMVPELGGYTWRNDGYKLWHDGAGRSCPASGGDTVATDFYTETGGHHSHGDTGAAGGHSHSASIDQGGAASGTIQTVPSYIAPHYIIRIK